MKGGHQSAPLPGHPHVLDTKHPDGPSDAWPDAPGAAGMRRPSHRGLRPTVFCSVVSGSAVERAGGTKSFLSGSGGHCLPNTSDATLIELLMKGQDVKQVASVPGEPPQPRHLPAADASLISCAATVALKSQKPSEKTTPDILDFH